jgi:hypothetical protein
MPFKHPCTAQPFFPERLPDHFQGVCCTFSEICTKYYTVPLSDPSQRLQMKGRKKSARPPSCVKFCTLAPKIC